jgi:soluble lytic murein transglycosylase-like protein
MSSDESIVTASDGRLCHNSAVIGRILVIGTAGIAQVVAASPGAVRPAHPDAEVWSRPVLEEIVHEAAQRENLDPRLVASLVTVESAWNPTAVSHKGALGLMQLMPATAARLDVEDAFDPHDNVRGGVTELARLIDRYAGNLNLALAAYNAGEGAVARYRGVPPFAETRSYVERILSLYTGRTYRLSDPAVRRAPVRMVRDQSSGRTVITNQRDSGTAQGMRIERAGATGSKLEGGFGSPR